MTEYRAVVLDALRDEASTTLDGHLTPEQAAATALAALADAIRYGIHPRYGPQPGSPGLALTHLADQLDPPRRPR